MSTSLLYHAFGVSGVKYKSTEYSEGQVRFHGEVTQHFKCSKCVGTHLIFKGVKVRSLHLPPIGKKPCFLDLTTHRVQCKECDHLYWPHLPFVHKGRRMTGSFARYVGDLLQFSTIQDVAQLLGIGWDTVKRIHKEYLQSKYRSISLKDVEYISIDEFSIKKRHKYMTVVSDIKSGHIIYAVEGRKEKHVKKFFKRLKKTLLS